MPQSEMERDLNRLEADLKRLEAEYNMYFAGRLPKPPWETRSRVAAMVKQYDRAYIRNYGDRFRFMTMQSRFAALIERSDRGLRAREEGRPGPFAPPKTGTGALEKPPADRVVHVAAFHDPMRETDKLHELYDSLAVARRTIGADPVPFHKFAEVVKQQMTRLKAEGTEEVAFRVSVKDGKVKLTARALKGAEPSEE